VRGPDTSPGLLRSPVAVIPNVAVIIRCMWERGEVQKEAFGELARRGLWLTETQMQRALERPHKEA
jgi:hypothetical protein